MGALGLGMDSEVGPAKSVHRCFLSDHLIKHLPRKDHFHHRKKKQKIFWVQSRNARQMKNCEVFRRTKEYTENTTLHGLKYVGADDLHFTERLFWTLAFVSGVLGAIYFITILYKRWDDNPMIISLSPTATLLTAIPFPSITICNMNGAKKSVAEDILNNENSDAKALLEKEMLRDICNEGMNDTDHHLEVLDANWTTIREFMTKVSQPCQEMLVSCRWRNEYLPCEDIFYPELTDEGMCCVFNKVERRFIFKHPKLIQGLRRVHRYPNIDWNPEIGYPDDVPLNGSPWRAFGPGMSMGLSVVLDAALKDYFCSSTASAGFKILLHNPIETPKVSDYAFFITTGLETRVEIMPKISSSTRSLFSIPQAKRRCVFSSDRDLRFFRAYDQRNCELECQSNFTLDHCECVPFYLPKDVKTRICGRRDNQCVNRVKDIFNYRFHRQTNSTEWDIENLENCSCLPSCVQIQYGKQMSTSKLEDVFMVKPKFLNGKDLTYYKENMAVVHFFFLENSFTGFEKGEIFGFTDFLSNTGGLLGLFLGFSFMSAAEIIYFMSLRIFCSWYRKQPSVKQNKVDSVRYPFMK